MIEAGSCLCFGNTGRLVQRLMCPHRTCTNKSLKGPNTPYFAYMGVLKSPSFPPRPGLRPRRPLMTLLSAHWSVNNWLLFQRTPSARPRPISDLEAPNPSDPILGHQWYQWPIHWLTTGKRRPVGSRSEQINVVEQSLVVRRHERNLVLRIPSLIRTRRPEQAVHVGNSKLRGNLHPLPPRSRPPAPRPNGRACVPLATHAGPV